MIEHKRLLGEPPGNLDGLWQLVPPHQQVIRHAKIAKPGKPTLKILAQHKIVVRLVDEHVTYAAKKWLVLIGF